jgi:serum/glucocorticoid-regulated kinase 2
MYEKIINKPLTFNDDFFNTDAKSMLKGLLTRESSKRLGARGADEIKKHPFFVKVNIVTYAFVQHQDLPYLAP